MQARLALEGNRLLMTTTFDRSNRDEFETARSRAKSVMGARWMPSKKCWSYPLNPDVCRELRSLWQDGLRVHREVSAWYRTTVEQQKDQVQKATAGSYVLQRLQHVNPEFALMLRPDQHLAASWVRDAYKDAGILADEPGVGKTYAAIAGLIERGVTGPVLIVSPKVSVRTVWERSLAFAGIEAYAARGTRAQREKAIAAFCKAVPTAHQEGRPVALVVVAEMLRAKGKRSKHVANGRFQHEGFEYWQLFDNSGWSAVLLDESHKLLGGMTITKGNLMAEGLRRLPLAPSGLRLAITGTPWGKGGRVEAMFGTLHWLWPDEYPSFWRWAGKYFEIEDQYISERVGSVKKIHGLRSGMTEGKFYAELGPRLLRRKMDEVFPEMKDRMRYVELLCEMEGKQLKQYRALGEDGELALPGGILTVTGVLADLTRARQSANGVLDLNEEGKVVYTGESNKLDMLMAKLEERGYFEKGSEQKVVIASQFNEFLVGVVAKELDRRGLAYHLLTGATSEKNRDRIMDDFQSVGGALFILVNSRAAGISINLDAADEMYQLDEMYPPEANEQLHRRIFRASRVHNVTINYLRSEGTIDTAIAENVNVRLMEQLRVLDGRRGVEAVRSLVRYRAPKEGK